MGDLTRLRRAFAGASHENKKQTTYRATIGDNNRRVASGRTGYVWARVSLPEGLTVTEILCLKVTPSLGLHVLVAYNVNDILEAQDVDPIQGPTYYGDLGVGNVGPHAALHGRLGPDAMRVDPLQVDGLLVTPTDPPSTAVKLGSWFYQTSATTYEWWPGGTVDLVGYFPQAQYEQRPVIVGLDRNTNAPAVSVGTTGLYVGYTPYQVPFTGADVAAIDGTAEFEASAGVRLRYNMGTVENYDVFLDCRRWVGDGWSAGISGGGSSGPLNNYAATAAPTVGDDSGDGYTVGSEWVDTTNDNTYKAVDVSSGAAVWVQTNTSDPYVFEGRLTLQSGVPVPSTAQLAKTTVYCTPCSRDMVALDVGRVKLYNTTTSSWAWHTFSEISASVPSSTDTTYNAYIYLSGGTMTLGFTDESSDTITTQNGIQVQSGSLHKLWIGKIRTTATSGQTQDGITTSPDDSSINNTLRFCINRYNQVPRKLYVHDSTTSWTSTSTTFQDLRASPYNRAHFLYVAGGRDVYLKADWNGVHTTNNIYVGIGLDTSTAHSGDSFTGGGGFNGIIPLQATYLDKPSEGYHTLRILQKVQGGTGTFYGIAAAGPLLKSAATGWVWG